MWVIELIAQLKHQATTKIINFGGLLEPLRRRFRHLVTCPGEENASMWSLHGWCGEGLAGLVCDRNACLPLAGSDHQVGDDWDLALSSAELAGPGGMLQPVDRRTPSRSPGGSATSWPSSSATYSATSGSRFELNDPCKRIVRSAARPQHWLPVGKAH